MPSTVDPCFLSQCLTGGPVIETAALLFHHVLDPQGPALTGLRTATSTDHDAAVTFAQAATGASVAFLRPYYADRIEREELMLLVQPDSIIASGECRLDQKHTGYAHLGMIVGQDHREHGLGSQLMNALVESCRSRDLKPLCSTEPVNVPAQHVINKAGFRARHRVFRVKLHAQEN